MDRVVGEGVFRQSLKPVFVTDQASVIGDRQQHLAQHGSKDTRCPLELDRDFINLLKQNKAPNRFVVWQGQGHGFGDPGSPILDKVLENVRLWFKQYGMFESIRSLGPRPVRSREESDHA